MTHEDKVAELLELWRQVDPDPADRFEDLLAVRGVTVVDGLSFEVVDV